MFPVYKGRAHNSEQEWFGALEFGADELQHKLFHVILHIWMLHDLSTKSCRHVQCTKTLLGRAMGAQDGVDESKDWKESNLGPVCGEGEQEGGSSRYWCSECFVFV